MKTQPSSLPLSERLRFFSSLSEAGKRNSCSFTRSPPFNSIERSSSIGSYHYYMATTPRSSTSLSSASVTPTPMECPLPIFIESPTILRKDSSSESREANDEANVMSAAEPAHDLTDSRFAIKADIVKTSPFLQACKQALPIPAHVAETETTPTSTLTPTMKRIKLKTIGKLMLPSTFLNNDRNNNNSKESSSNKESSDSNGENENSGPPKKIGKIKSPFIENCNIKHQKQMQINTKCMTFDYNNKSQNSLTALTSLENSAEHHNMDVSSNSNGICNGNGLNQRKYQNSSLQTNGHHHHNEDLSTDSGKENVDTSLREQTTPVVEMRRKFTRKANTSQSFNTSGSSGITRQLTPRSASLNGPHSSPQVDDKYAKYFGVATSASKSTKTNQQAPPLPKQPPPTSPTQQDQFGQLVEKTPQPQVMAVNRNVRLWHSSGRGIKRMASVISELKKFEDIVVTDRELKLASKEFDNLLHNDSLLKHSSKELDRIFSSIV